MLPQVSVRESTGQIVALDCVEIDGLAPPPNEVTAAQDLADRVAAMLTKLIRAAETPQRKISERDCRTVRLAPDRGEGESNLRMLALCSQMILL
ncbi:MAG TPA: hypothetical protein ENK57_06585 [Polyangiaceae bacterium]|nr:hypothetical protein [Polyangiaceae bacterium]